MSPTKSSNTKTTCGCLAVVIVVVGIIIAVASGKNSKSNSGEQIQGIDPKSFQTAQELYSFTPKPALSVSDTASQLTKFRTFVSAGAYPEEAEFRSILLLLDGAVDKAAVLSAIQAAVPSYTSRSSSTGVSTTVVKNAFDKGNSLYETGKFESAATSYIQVLQISPVHLDARNNLGLADLHLGNNISALMHFSLVMGISPQYLGAEQNLTVTLERIGLSTQAQAHAKSIVQQNATLPMAQYNLGWFQNLNKDYPAAEMSFNEALKLYAKYTKAQHAGVLNKLANGGKLTKSDLDTLSKAEKSAYSAINKTASAPMSNKAPTSTPAATVRPKSVAAWWWWVLMVIAIFILVFLMGRAATNEKAGATVWGLFSAIAVIIAVIVFAIFFRSNSTYSTVLWCFVILDIIIMIPSSSS